LDSENELCTREFKTLQQALQQISNGESLLQQSKFEEAILEFQSLLPLYPTIGFFVKKGRWNICQATSKLKNSKKTLEVCQSVLELEDNHFDTHMLMGEASLELEDFEEAVRFFRKATEIQPQNQQAHQSLQRAEKLRKMALRKDYYKILGMTQSFHSSLLLTELSPFSSLYSYLLSFVSALLILPSEC
jgi:DnaJ family protein C protein 3